MPENRRTQRRARERLPALSGEDCRVLEHAALLGYRFDALLLAALETVPDSASRVDQLAYHALESGDRDKTRLYNERAGDRAFQLRALPEAGQYFQVALRAATGDAARVRLLAKIAAVQEHSRTPT